VVCRVRIDDGLPQTQLVPCRFRVRAGQRLHLTALKRGLRSFTEEWTVQEPRTIALEVLDRPGRIVLAGEEVTEPPLSAVGRKRRQGGPTRKAWPRPGRVGEGVLGFD
jgi:hypothetical protein